MTAAAKSPRRRGEPLIALGALAMGWIAVRALAWQSPFPLEPIMPRAATPLAIALPQARPDAAVVDRPEAASWTSGRVSLTRFDRAAPTRRPPGTQHLASAPPSPPSASHFLMPPRQPLPPLLPAPGAIASTAPGGDFAAAPAKRWHIDGWVTWRQGAIADATPGQPLTTTYGASQAGMLARLSLASSDRRPEAYLRAVHAPNGADQSDLALGLGARPLARVPLRVQAEMRATRSQGDTFIRPAVIAVSEFAPLELPLGLRAEGYMQGGWVGGRFATGFLDGQARLDREIVAAGPAKLRLGAGVWGGVQQAAGRLDVGPTLMLDAGDSALPARLSLDYRRQVAGNARPGSGMAVTLSTGF